MSWHIPVLFTVVSVLTNIRNSLLYSLLIAFLVFQTSVMAGYPGGPENSEHWTKDDSPVLITSDLEFSELIIDPGVEVHFTGNFEIKINGTIESNGTRYEPVIFKESSDNMVGWKGLYFIDTIEGSVFTWTEISGATDTGVHLIRSTPSFDHVTFKNNTAPEKGGAIRAVLGSKELIFNHCVFEGNYAEETGGAIFANDPTGSAGAALVVNECFFKLNKAGKYDSTRRDTEGGAIFINGNGRILHSSFRQNRAEAYTIYASGGRYTRGGGVYVSGGSTEISSCSFIKNGCKMGAHYQTPDKSRPYGGAIHHASGQLLLSSCLVAKSTLVVAKNPDRRGGGLHIASGFCTIVNCTFADNDYHAVYRNGGGGIATNSIFFFNNSGGKQNYPEDTLTPTYCDIQLGVPGEGNISSNPVFTDPPNDDYTLQVPSECIDSGKNLSALNGQDLGRNPRILDGDLDLNLIVDMGAYEYNNVHLDISGDMQPGGWLLFETTGTAGMGVLLIVGVAPGEIPYKQYGCILVDLAFPWILLPFGAIPGSSVVAISTSWPIPLELYIQALAFDGPQGGNMSNVVQLTIE